MTMRNNSSNQLMATVSTSEMQAEASDNCERWLLVFNCQVLGLANCLNLVTDEVYVEHYHPAGFKNNSRDVLERWDTFTRVLIAPQLLHMLPDHLRASEKIWKIPTVSFSAYHPDICYLINGKKPLKGPLGDYHSAIAYAGFKLGLSVGDVFEKYSEKTYARLGYFDRWDGSKLGLLGKFAEAGFDLGLPFANWTRAGSFMYSNNHAKIQCLMDIAKAIMAKADKEVLYLSELPHDNLMNGPGFPIYTEIGIRLGVQGNYLFKREGEYRFIRLERFLRESYSLYAETPDLSPMPEYSKMIENTINILGAS